MEAGDTRSGRSPSQVFLIGVPPGITVQLWGSHGRLAVAGLLVGAAVVKKESSFSVCHSNTWNQRKQMCVLVEGIVTEANKLACSVLFLLS